MTTTDHGRAERAPATRGSPARRALPAVTALALLVDAVAAVAAAGALLIPHPQGAGALETRA